MHNGSVILNSHAAVRRWLEGQGNI